MNIDLLLTKRGVPGLVADGAFASEIAYIMLDTQMGLMTAEFTDGDTLEFNVPVSEDYIGILAYSGAIHLGIIEKSAVQDARLVELVPFNHEEAPVINAVRPRRSHPSVSAFKAFMQEADKGQPVHRDDLGNEATLDGVLSGLNPAVLDLAPHLKRQQALEAQPKMAPRGPAGPSGPGGMGGGGGGGGYSNPVRYDRPGDDDDA